MSAKSVTISINAKAKPKAKPSSPGKRRGPLKGHRGAEILHRRTQPAGINFYSLGYLKGGNGHFHDLNFTVAYGGPDSGGAQPADYAARDAAIFAITGSDLAGHAYKLTKRDMKAGEAGNLRFEVVFASGGSAYIGELGEAAEFSDEKGLVLSSEQFPPDTFIRVANLNADNIGFISGEANSAIFDVFNVGPGSSTSIPRKVTAVNDPNAAEVDFIPSKKMDIFLPPSLNFLEPSGPFFTYEQSFFVEHNPPVYYPDAADRREGFHLTTDAFFILAAIIRQNGRTFYVWTK